VQVFRKIFQKKGYVPSVPLFILVLICYPISLVGKILKVNHPFHPVRIKKTVRSNNVIPEILISHGFQFRYTLENAQRVGGRGSIGFFVS
jgi:hypothetical protein